MEDFSTLQNLWLTQPVEQVPSESEMLDTIKTYRHKAKRNFMLTQLIFLVCVVLMVLVVFYYPSTMLTTRIGEALIIATIFYGAFLKWKTFKHRGHHTALSASAFLDKLKHDEVKSCTGSANEQATAFSLLTVAYAFYLYESVSGSIATLCIGYGLMAAVLGGLWFVYRPYKVRQREKKIQQLITKIETLKSEIS